MDPQKKPTILESIPSTTSTSTPRPFATSTSTTSTSSGGHALGSTFSTHPPTSTLATTTEKSSSSGTPVATTTTSTTSAGGGRGGIIQRVSRKRKRPSPRTRKRHKDSSGESSNEDSDYAYRALRSDEEPLTEGLQPPKGHDPSKTASQHVTAGSRAKVQGPYVSLTRSKKVAGAWASTGRNAKRQRVVKVRVPKGRTSEYYDLTKKKHQDQIFPRGGTGLNSAKSSQEVLVRGGIGPENIEALFQVGKFKNLQNYRRFKASERRRKYRSRTKAKERPRAFSMKETYRRAPKGSQTQDKSGYKADSED